MSKAVHTKKPEMAWAAVVMRNIGCSTAVGLPSSGIREKLGATAGVVAIDPNLGAAVMTVITIMVPSGVRFQLGLLESRPRAKTCQGREPQSNWTQLKGLRSITVTVLCISHMPFTRLLTCFTNGTWVSLPLPALVIQQIMWYSGTSLLLTTQPSRHHETLPLPLSSPFYKKNI